MEKKVAAILRALRVLLGHLGWFAAPVGPAGLSPWHVAEGLVLCLSGVALGQKTQRGAQGSPREQFDLELLF